MRRLHALFHTNNDHKALLALIVLGAAVGLVLLVVLAHLARSSHGRRRAGFLLLIASVVLLFAATAAMVMDVDNEGSSPQVTLRVECGPPLVSRPDVDAALNEPRAAAAAFCEREFSQRRRFAVGALVMAAVAAAGAVVLLIGARGGDDRRTSGSSAEVDRLLSGTAPRS